MPHGKVTQAKAAARDENERRRLVDHIVFKLNAMSADKLRRVLLVVAQVERERAS